MHNLKPLKAFANILLFLAWIAAAGGVIGGIILATRENGPGRQSEANPYLVEGISIAVSSLIGATLLAVVAYWAIAWADVTQEAETRRHTAEMRERGMNPANRLPPP